MNQTHVLYLFIIAHLCSFTALHSWSGSGSVEGDQKQQVNFFGTLDTHQGQKEMVDNISIQGKYKDIVMYDAPENKYEEIANPKTKQQEIKLTENPSESFIKSKINLCSIKEIHVSKPNTIWYYQKANKSQRIDFTEIEIIPQEGPAKKYLIEHKTHLNCNSRDKAAEKKEVPITAIDKLVIEGYGERVETTSCPVAKNPKKTTATMPKVD